MQLSKSKQKHKNKQKSKHKETSSEKAARKQEKKKKKAMKELQQKQEQLKQKEKQSDSIVNLIYQSGLADAYKYFLKGLYEEGLKQNVYEFAAQKILKYERVMNGKK